MKKYLSLFLAVLMLVSMIPVLSLAEDDEQADDQVDTLANVQPDPFNDHTFSHLDVRIAGATFTLKHNIKDAAGNVITTKTESVTANVTKVYSVTINGQKYTNFEQSGSYEFRKTRNVSIKGSDITDSTKAVIVVDLKDANGKEYKNVTFTLNKAKIVEAAKECDGYKSTHAYDGLDFELSGVISEDDVEVSVESTDIAFEITKKLDGELCTTADLFEFELWQGENLVASAKNDATGKATISVSYADLTDFSDITYTVKEKIGSGEYEYDTNAYTITVGFRDAEEVNGKYVRYPYVKDGQITNLVFNNTTKATPAASESADPTATPAASESTNPTETPAATDTPAPEKTPGATESANPTETPAPSDSDNPSAGPEYKKVEFKVVKNVDIEYNEPIQTPQDATFTFQIQSLGDLWSNDAHDIKVEFNDTPIGEDGKFALQVSCGLTRVSGTLTFYIPDTAWETDIQGYIKEIGCNAPDSSLWTLDTSKLWFKISNGEGTDTGKDVPGDTAVAWQGGSTLTFVNKFNASATPTPAPTPKYEYVDFTIEKKVVDDNGEPVALEEDTTFTFRIYDFAAWSGNHAYTFTFNDKPIGENGEFTLTVKAGASSATGKLTVGVPETASITAARGYIKEIGCSGDAQNWELDSINYYFYLPKYGSENSPNFRPDVSIDPANPADANMTFTNKYVDPIYYIDVPIEKVIKAVGEMPTEDTTVEFKVAVSLTGEYGTLTGADVAEFTFNGDPVEGELVSRSRFEGTFTLTVEKGKTSANGTLRIGILRKFWDPENVADRRKIHISVYEVKGSWIKHEIVEPWCNETLVWGAEFNKSNPDYGEEGWTFTKANGVYETAEPTSVDRFSYTNEYLEKDVTIAIPVKKVVEQTGTYLPSSDTTFDFQLNLSSWEELTVKLGDTPIGTDGKFSLTLKAGQTEASDFVYISGSVWKLRNLTGSLQEIVPASTGKWTYDTREYKFTLADFCAVELVDGHHGFSFDFDQDSYITAFKSVVAGDDGVVETPVDATVGATFTNQYEDNVAPEKAIEIPIRKVVEKTGAYLPSVDTTFNFKLTLSNKEMGTDKLVVKYDGKEITDGQFSLTVKAGETLAEGVLRISGPMDQMACLTGTLEEIAPKDTGKWIYDTKEYVFALNVDCGFELFGYLYDNNELNQAATAEFTNQYKEEVPRTTLTVKKVWEDKGYEKKRPESVTVELYYYQKDKNGNDTKTKVLYKVNGEAMSAVLNENNGWTYTFENLDARFTWTVDEVKTPTGYSRKVTLSADKKTVTVTNTYGAQPKTGFDGLPLILCMVAVMLAGGVALVVINRKKGSRKSN